MKSWGVALNTSSGETSLSQVSISTRPLQLYLEAKERGVLRMQAQIQMFQ